MIPKTIHYCWFGGKPLPKSARKCIDSWRQFLPNYEIKEWNENNFDVFMIPYTAEAYAAKKFAFVSDFARFYVLHKYGGLYFDTDVEVIRPMEDIANRGAFMGMENGESVNPGLGLGAPTEHPFYEWYLHYFSDKHFTPDQPSMVPVITRRLRELGWKPTQEPQQIADLTVYPPDYFCPQARMGDPIRLTDRTHSIHHFDGTWLPLHQRVYTKVKSCLRSVLFP